MHAKIELNPRVCYGKPVIRGTRVLVSTILGALAGGDTINIILEDYPNITSEDVLEALRFASELCQFEDHPYEAIAS